MTSVATDFLHLCNEYRQAEPTGAVFADVVDQRLNQAYLPSRPIVAETFPNKEKIQARLQQFINNNKDHLKKLDEHKDGFITFLKHINDHINSSNEREFKGCSNPEICYGTSCPDEEEFLMYHVYIILACRCFFICESKDEEWKKLRDFVINVAIRMYRLPQTVRYLNAINAHLFNFNPPVEKEEYLILREIITSNVT